MQLGEDCVASRVLGPHWRRAVAVSVNAHILEHSEDQDKAGGRPPLNVLGQELGEVVDEAAPIVSLLPSEETSLLCHRPAVAHGV